MPPLAFEDAPLTGAYLVVTVWLASVLGLAILFELMHRKVMRDLEQRLAVLATESTALRQELAHTREQRDRAEQLALRDPFGPAAYPPKPAPAPPTDPVNGDWLRGIDGLRGMW